MAEAVSYCGKCQAVHVPGDQCKPDRLSYIQQKLAESRELQAYRLQLRSESIRLSAEKAKLAADQARARWGRPDLAPAAPLPDSVKITTVPGKRDLPGPLRYDPHRFHRRRLGIKSEFGGNEYRVDRTILENGGSGMVRVSGTEDENWTWLAGEDADSVSGQTGVLMEDPLNASPKEADSLKDDPEDNPKDPKRPSLNEVIVAARMDEFERRVVQYKLDKVSREKAMAERQDMLWKKGIQAAWRKNDRSGEERLRTAAERLKRNKTSGLQSKVSRRRY